MEQVDLPEGPEDQNTQEVHQQHPPINNIEREEDTRENTQEIDELKEILNLAFENALSEFAHIEPNKRPRIPKPKQSKQMDIVMHVMNTHIMLDYAKKELSFEEVHAAIYCGAVAVVRQLGLKMKLVHSQNIKTNKTPKWERRLVKRINELRRDIGRLEQFRMYNRSKNIYQYCLSIFEKFKINIIHETPNEATNEYLDTLKQKVSALAKRLRRYKECSDRKEQNKMFKEKEKEFYQQINKKEEIVGNGVPSKTEIEQFWGGIWSNPLMHNHNATWIQDEIEAMSDIEEMTFDGISVNDIKSTIRNTHNWKAPGNDNIQNFWYKKFSNMHTQIAKCLNEFIIGDKDLPDFFTEGMTFLKPKDNDTKNPSKYRPITCYQLYTKS